MSLTSVPTIKKIPVHFSPVELSRIFGMVESITSTDDQTRQLLVGLAKSLDRDHWLQIFSTRQTMPVIEANATHAFELNLDELKFLADVLTKVKITGWSNNIATTELNKKILGYIEEFPKGESEKGKPKKD